MAQRRNWGITHLGPPFRAGITGGLIGWLCGLVVHALFFSAPEFRLAPGLVLLIMVAAGGATGGIVGHGMREIPEGASPALRGAWIGGAAGAVAGIVVGAVVGLLIAYGSALSIGTGGQPLYVAIILAILFGPLCGAVGIIIGLVLGLWASVTRGRRAPLQ